MSIENLAQYFGAIEDPRCSDKVGHRLLDILVIAVCACHPAIIRGQQLYLHVEQKDGWRHARLRPPAPLTNGGGQSATSPDPARKRTCSAL